MWRSRFRTYPLRSAYSTRLSVWCSMETHLETCSSVDTRTYSATLVFLCVSSIFWLKVEVTAVYYFITFRKGNNLEKKVGNACRPFADAYAGLVSIPDGLRIDRTFSMNRKAASFDGSSPNRNSTSSAVRLTISWVSNISAMSRSVMEYSLYARRSFSAVFPCTGRFFARMVSRYPLLNQNRLTVKASSWASRPNVSRTSASLNAYFIGNLVFVCFPLPYSVSFPAGIKDSRFVFGYGSQRGKVCFLRPSLDAFDFEFPGFRIVRLVDADRF